MGFWKWILSLVKIEEPTLIGGAPVEVPVRAQVVGLHEVRVDFHGLEKPVAPMSKAKKDALQVITLEEMKSLESVKCYNTKNDEMDFGSWVDKWTNKPSKKYAKEPKFVGKARTYDLQKFISARIPDSSLPAGLEAFFRRHCVPKVHKAFDIDWEQFYQQHNLDEEFRLAMMKCNFPTFEEWWKDVDSKKKGAYMKGWLAFQERPKIAMNLQIITKPDEKQVKDSLDEDKFKARNIFNPSNTVKAVLGYVAYLYMLVVKSMPFFKNSFVQAWTSEMLEEQVMEDFLKLEDPVAAWWDGANHDAHQHSDFIKGVDNRWMSKWLPAICAKAGFNVAQTEEIVRKATVDKCTINLFYPNFLIGQTLLGAQRIKIFSGKLNQTTFSGHPTRTTLFNTKRILCLIHKIADDAGLTYKKHYFVYQSGDDTYMLFERWAELLFRKEHAKYYAFEEGQTHGYGQWCKDYKVSDQGDGKYAWVDFLSKLGVVSKWGVWITRACRRIAATGDTTSKLTPKFSEEMYLGGVKHQLLAHYKSWPCYQALIDYKFGDVKADKRGVVHEYKNLHDASHEYNDIVMAIHPDSDKLKILEACQGETTYVAGLGIFPTLNPIAVC